jgi:hypothetical protein
MFAGCVGRAWVGMPSAERWEHAVLALLDDLEMQAEGLHLAERAVEVGELSVAEYAEVRMLARLHASTGREVRVGLGDSLEVHGRLARVGADWLLLHDAVAAWFVHLPAVLVVSGLDPHAVPDEALPVSARLSLRSVLRRLADERRAYSIHLRGGRVLHGSLLRVGADFLELRVGDVLAALVVPLTAVAAVRESGDGP